MPQVPRRGRPPTGRKTVYQVALDDDPHGEMIANIADAEGKPVSAVLRELVVEALAGRKRRK